MAVTAEYTYNTYWCSETDNTFCGQKMLLTSITSINHNLQSSGMQVSMNQLRPTRATWIEVSEQALRTNVAQIQKLLPASCRLMAVVKANAYGHSAIDVAPILLDAGANYLAVATLGEALELRQSGITSPILVLGFTPTWLAADAVQQAITLTVFDSNTATHYNAAADALNQPLRVHVKVNTGMNRLGVKPDQAIPLFQQLAHLSHLEVEGVFTHFATSDLLDKSFAREQFARFATLLHHLTQHGLRPPLAHAANSAALLTMPETHLDMVRSGIALYGLHPDPDETQLPSGFQPALSWKAVVAQVNKLEPGESVSYGQEFVATRRSTIAVVPIGYADGFPRKPNNYGSLLIHGQPAPIVGRVCMDQVMIDVTDIDRIQQVCQSDEVVVIGRQGDAEITVEQVAQTLRTNNYDVVSRILSRVPRIISP